VKILQWALPYLPTRGGREVFISRLSLDLKEMGHEIRVVANERSENSPFVEEVFEDFPILRLNLELLKDPKTSHTFAEALERAHAFIRDMDPEIIHFHNTYDAGSLLLIEVLKKLEKRPKVVLTYHSLADHETLVTGRKLDFLSRYIDCAILPSKFNYSMVGAFSAIPRERLRFIYNGVPIPDSVERTEAAEPYFLYAGRLNSDKGVGVLLSALRLLVERYPEVRLKIAGAGLMEKQLKDFTQMINLESSVDFLGWKEQDELRELIKGSLAVIMPSTLSEPFGLIGAEAQSLAVPLIASRVGGLAEIPEDSVTGLLLPAGDFGLLSQAMRYLYEHPEIRKSYGLAGAERAAELFSIEKSHKAYEACFKELISQ